MKKITVLCTIIFVGQLYCMNESKNDYTSLLPELKQQIIATALSTSTTLADVISMLEKLSALHNIPFASLNKHMLTQELMKKFPEKVKDEIILAIHKPKTYQEIVTIIANTLKAYKGYKSLQKASQIIEKQKLFHDLQDFTAIAHMLAEIHPPKITEYSTRFFTAPIAKEYVALGKRLISSILESDTNTAVILIGNGADVNYRSSSFSPLTLAASENNINLVKLFLHIEANPYLNPITPLSPSAAILTLTTNEEIKELLEKAMQK